MKQDEEDSRINNLQKKSSGRSKRSIQYPDDYFQDVDFNILDEYSSSCSSNLSLSEKKMLFVLDKTDLKKLFDNQFKEYRSYDKLTLGKELLIEAIDNTYDK